MKPINALILSLFAGVLTFAAQNSFPPKVHAAPHGVPIGPDWRQQLLERDRGEVGIDHWVGRLSERLDLTPEQTSKVRAIFRREHERSLALLLTAPASLSRDEFIADEKEIKTQAHRQLDGVLSKEQLELAQELHAASSSSGS